MSSSYAKLLSERKREIKSMLERYFSTFNNSMTIKTDIGDLTIIDKAAIAEIKAVIFRRAKSWTE